MIKIRSSLPARQIKRWEEMTRNMSTRQVGGSGWTRSAKNKLEKVFTLLDQQGKIGNLVLDAGASKASLAVEFGSQRSSYTVISVDIGFDVEVREAAKIHRDEPDCLRVKGDLHSLGPALDRPEITTFLQNRSIQRLRFDTILMSDILNYVDFKQVIPDLRDMFLAPGGRLIICNMAGIIADPLLEHPRGVKRNSELLGFLQQTDLVLEKSNIPDYWLDRTDDHNCRTRQVLVYRK